MLERGFAIALVLSAALVVTTANVVSRASDEPAGAGTEARQKVRRLVDALDAEARSARLSAQQTLLSMGPSILPLLPAEESIASPAAREAVRQIREKLERDRASSTLTASRVTLHGELSIAEILDRIAQQTGNTLGRKELAASIMQRKLAVDDQSRPFWNACDDIINRAGLAYGTVSNGSALELISESGAAHPHDQAVDDSGPIRVAIASVELRPTVGLSSRRLLRIGWSLRAEPRLRPLYARIATGDLFVRTPSGLVLKPDVPAAKFELSMGEGGPPLSLTTDFVVPGNVAVIPASVEFGGSLHVVIAAGPEQLDFDLGAEGRRSRRVGTVTVGLQNVEFHPGRNGRVAARLEIALLYDRGGPAFESYRSWMYRNNATLVSKDGRRIAPSEVLSMRQQGDGSVVAEYNFANVEGRPGDYRFLYVVPTLIADLPVQLHFPNVPLTRTSEKGVQR